MGDLSVRETALSKYDPAQYNLLARPEDFSTSPLIKLELAVVKIDPRDVREGGEVHTIGGQKTPSRSALDKIADATGIDFTESRSWKEDEHTWVCSMTGRRKQPDGTWRYATADYELDLEARAEEIRKRNGSQASKETEILQLRKFARQRANTGARLRVIRALTGLKTGFTPDELSRPFVFPRFSVNMEAALRDPDMKRAALNQALGVTADLYGASAEPRDVTPRAEEPAQIEAPAEEEAGVEFAADEAPDPRDALRNQLQDFLNADTLGSEICSVIGAVKDNPQASVEALQNMVNSAERAHKRALEAAQTGDPA